jgi:hypothetical protein
VGELTRSLSPTRTGSATMLATEILARSGTEQDCADILNLNGSVGVWFERHHAKWSQARQQTITKPFVAVYPGAGAYRYTTKSHCYSIASYGPDHGHSILSISVNRKVGSFPIPTRPTDQASRGRRAVRFSLPSALHAGEPRESADLAARIGPAGPRRKPMLPYSVSMIELAGVSFLVLLDGAQTLSRPLVWWDEQAGRRGWRYLRYPRTAP